MRTDDAIRGSARTSGGRPSCRSVATAGLAALLCLSACKSDSAATNRDSGPASRGDTASPDASVAPEVKGPDADAVTVDLLAVEISPSETRSVSETSAEDRPGANALTDAAPAEDMVLDGPKRDGRGDAECTGWTTLARLKPAEVKELLDTLDPVLINVINVHGPGADIPGTDVYIPSSEVDKIEDYLHHDHCADVLLLCKGGGMSAAAGDKLVRRGYLRIRDILGGVNAWVLAGYPLREDGGI